MIREIQTIKGLWRRSILSLKNEANMSLQRSTGRERATDSVDLGNHFFARQDGASKCKWLRQCLYRNEDWFKHCSLPKDTTSNFNFCPIRYWILKHYSDLPIAVAWVWAVPVQRLSLRSRYHMFLLRVYHAVVTHHGTRKYSFIVVLEDSSSSKCEVLGLFWHTHLPEVRRNCKACSIFLSSSRILFCRVKINWAPYLPAVDNELIGCTSLRACIQ